MLRADIVDQSKTILMRYYITITILTHYQFLTKVGIKLFFIT
jgi:hypothetical protein